MTDARLEREQRIAFAKRWLAMIALAERLLFLKRRILVGRFYHKHIDKSVGRCQGCVWCDVFRVGVVDVVGTVDVGCCLVRVVCCVCVCVWLPFGSEASVYHLERAIDPRGQLAGLCWSSRARGTSTKSGRQATGRRPGVACSAPLGCISSDAGAHVCVCVCVCHVLSLGASVVFYNLVTTQIVW